MLNCAECLQFAATLQWFVNCFTSVIGNSINSDWMANLPEPLQHVPLTNLAIPGAHDSGTYSLTPTQINVFQHDKFSRYLQMAYKSSNKERLAEEIYRWSRTQDLNITEQLQLGVRYLDMRVAVNENGKCHMVHRLVGTSLTNIFEQILHFIRIHSKEIILLDFNHVYFNHTVSKHTAQNIIIDDVMKYFRTRLCPSKRANKASLQELWTRRCQVIVFYPLLTWKRDLGTNKFICPRRMITSPFNHKYFTQKSTWLHFLNSNYMHRRPARMFFVTQGIMEAHWMEIAIAGISKKATLKNWISNDATKEVVKWLKTKQAGEYGVNIIIADFVEDHDFVQTVLALNVSKTYRSTNSPFLLVVLIWLTVTLNT